MKKKYVIATVAAVICALILCVFIWAFPLLQAARSLRRVADAESIDYEINVTLDQGKLTEGQEQFLQAVSWILELDKESCMSWKINGHISSGQGYAQVFCEGVDGAVTDVYFREGDAVINVKMLYGMLQENFSGAHPILGNLLPEWKYSDYISLEQIEQIFQVDIKGMYRLDLPKEMPKKNIWETLVMLQKIKRAKIGDGRQQFEAEWNGYQIAFQIGKAKLSIQGSDTTDSQIIESYKALFSAGEAEQIRFPDSVMRKDEAEKFQDFWNIVKGLLGSIGKEQ